MAALTVMRAAQLADAKLEVPWVFTEWDAIVRRAVIQVGRRDPYESIRRLASDEERDGALDEAPNAWLLTIGDGWVTLSAVVQKALWTMRSRPSYTSPRRKKADGCGAVLRLADNTHLLKGRSTNVLTRHSSVEVCRVVPTAPMTS